MRIAKWSLGIAVLLMALTLSACVCQIQLGGKHAPQYGNASSSEKTAQDAMDLLKQIETRLARKESLNKADTDEISKNLKSVKEILNNNNFAAKNAETSTR